MDNITYVSPFTVNTNNNRSVLSLLRNYEPLHKDETISVNLIPVYETKDLATILSQNLRRKPGSSGRGEESGASHEISENLKAEAEVAAEATHFVELTAIYPQNRQQQVSTILFENFPMLRRDLVERILNQILALAPTEVSKDYKWSTLEYGSIGSHSDVTNVFVTFASVETVEWISSNVDIIGKALPGVTLVVDKDVEKKPASITESDVHSVKSEVERLVANKKNFSIDTNKTGTEDLDEVMQYYRTYKVENSELVEVPEELKETIVKDIIKFRYKVLTLEKNRRKKEMEKERFMAKLRLTQIVEGIKTAAEVSDDTRVQEEDIEMAEEKADSMESLNDDEYDEYLANQEKKNLENAYAAKVKEMEKLEQLEKRRLVDQLDAAENYESNLMDNKLALIDEIKAYLDIDTALSSTNGNSKLRMYYTNHLEYLRIRNLEKSKEEKLDAADVLDNMELDSLPKVKLEKPQDSSLSENDNSTKSENSKPESMEVDVVISGLPAETLMAIETKIGDLIEEFLGIREDVLIEFVLDFIKEKNLGLKEELITELQETLDEDSRTVVNQLHEFIVLHVDK